MTSLIPNILKENNNRLVFCSILTLSGFPLLGLIAGFIFLDKKKILFRLKKIQIIFLFIAITSYLHGYISFGIHNFRPLLYIILIVFIFTNNINFTNKALELRFINIYIVSNIFYLCYEIFDIKNFNNRFETFFLEPSYLAIISGYLLIRLGFDKKKKAQIVILILLILITKSLTGMIFILYYSISNWRHFNMRSIVFFFLSLFLIFFYLIENTYLLERVNKISSDISTLIRIFLPLLVIKGVFNSEGVLGTGYGYFDDFLLNKYYTSSEFDFFLKYDFFGNVMYNTNIDNAYYYIVASVGVLGLLFCTYMTIYSLKKKGLKFTLITLILGFSMGFLTLPIFINRFLSKSNE